MGGFETYLVDAVHIAETGGDGEIRADGTEGVVDSAKSQFHTQLA